MTNNIRKIRLSKKIKMAEVARAIGVSHPFMWDLEHGNRGTRDENWEKIAEFLGCTVEELKNEQDDVRIG